MPADRAELKRLGAQRASILPHIPEPRATDIAIMVAVLRRPGCSINLEPSLVPIHRTLQRWAVTQGSDDVLLSWDDVPPESRPVPLPNDLAIKWDQLLLHGDPLAYAFVRRWYMSPSEAVVAFARELRIARTSIYPRWRAYLWYYKGKAQGEGLDV